MKKVCSLIKNCRPLFAAVLTICAIAQQTDARMINVRGQVTSKGSAEPIEGVTIRKASTDHLIGATNIDGRFSVTIEDTDSLIFSGVGTQSLTEPVKGRLQIDVALMPKAQELEELVVTAKNLGNTFTIEPTELNVKGNYIYLKKHVTIPHKIFSSGVRMIIQPSIYNVSRRSLTYLRPVVFDGHRYAITQKRMYDWNPELDPLLPYREVKKTGRRKDDVVTIADSLYVDKPSDDFMCVVMTSLENYNKVVYADTFMIARGTVNPLRFLDYELQGYELTDERYLPQPEIHLRDTRGDVRLSFAVGKSNLDMSMGDNAAEIDGMLNEFRVIASDPDMTLKSFKISGTASPEGSYERNLTLAAARMRSAMDVVRRSLPEGMWSNADIKTESSVAPWSSVSEMLRKDGQDRQAEAIDEIIARYPKSIDTQTARIRRLPFYRTIADNYLPKLRRVNYQIVSSRYRPLTDEEISAQYASDYRQMSKYNFWRLYKKAANDADREVIMRRAIEVHPDFLAAATDLSAMLINAGKPDASILSPFFTDNKTWLKLPEESRYDMAVCEMKDSHFSRADSLMYDLPDNGLFHKGKAYAAALNGRYLDVMQEISEDSPLNEVLLLLAMKDNETAWTAAQRLGGSAIEEYIKATAANRVDEYVEALAHLQEAFRLDPTLRETARVDGDIVDLLEDNKANESENNTQNGTDESI